MTRISALVSDVDGTLMTQGKQVTARTREAVAKLHAKGIPFAAISGRPPRGMRMLVEPLGITNPIAGFNGGQFTAPDLTSIEDHVLAPDVARRAHDMLLAKGVSIWVFNGLDWLIRDPDGPHVDHERHTVDYEPIVVKDFDKALSAAHKIVGISEDHDGLARLEADMQAALGDTASATRSQTYYLDVTHPQANKGAALHTFSRLLNVPLKEIAVIGDGNNDVLMFEQAGFSIAMGNGSDWVKSKASVVTGSNDDDGFATAIEKYVLGGGT
jgi:Cof subfamily protein (haloacid dehalogenase superfamily)